MMDALETLALILNSILGFLGQTTYILLNANHHFMTVLIGCATNLLNNVCSTLEAAFNLFHCYLIDFCTFVKEFVTLICLIVSYIAYVLQLLHVMFLSSFHSLFDITQYVLSAVYVCGASVCYVANSIAAVLIYASKLIFQAVILLLMFLPNVLLCLYNVLLRGAISIFHCFMIFGYHIKYWVTGTAHVVKVESASVFYSIPPKAYFGLLILIILYYKRRPVVLYSLKSFVLLTSFLRDTVTAVGIFLFTVFSHVLSSIINPFLWVLQWVSRSLSSFVSNGDPQQQGLNCFSVICSKLNFSRVFRKTLGSVFHDQKSADVNLTDPDQVAHLRYLEQKLNEERDRHLCIICQDEIRTVLLLPCRHLCLCSDCWDSLQDHSPACPVCRGYVYEAFHVYV